MTKQNIYNKKIGILGGGQLGKMIAQAASKLNLDIHFMDSVADGPVSSITKDFVTGSFKDYDHVMQFGADKDVLSIEIEAVNTDALKALQEHGKTVYPKPHLIDLIKDKGLQKSFYKNNEIPTSAFDLYDNAEQIRDVVNQGSLQMPFVQKLRTEGYDGRGVQIIRSEQDLELLFEAPSVVEDLIDLDKELALVIARNPSGDIAIYDSVEMVFHPTANLLEYQLAPAKIDTTQAESLRQIATRLVNTMDYVGLLAIEYFLDKKGQILVNEIAPRPHNSGHHSIEACPTSQFEQMLRSILDLPLGATDLRSHNAMMNILGADSGHGEPQYVGLDQAMAIPDVHMHIYGKKQSKPYRKLGHITILADDYENLGEKIEQVKNVFKTAVV